MTIDPAAAMPYFAPMHHPANGIAPLTTAGGGAAFTLVLPAEAPTEG